MKKIRLQRSLIVRQKTKKHLQINCKCLIINVAQLGLELFILNPILKGVYNKSNYNRDKKRDNFMFF